jgi:predicted RNA-binding protein with RPS1 domain
VSYKVKYIGLSKSYSNINGFTILKDEVKETSEENFKYLKATFPQWFEFYNQVTKKRRTKKEAEQD